jgi:hypothetical protein
MDRSILAALAIAGAIGAGVLSIDERPPPHQPGDRRTVILKPCAADWSAWAIAWCPDDDAACIDANDDRQGNPMCVGGIEVGQCASTPATPSQEARARLLGVVLERPAGWEACPDESP